MDPDELKRAQRIAAMLKALVEPCGPNFQMLLQKKDEGYDDLETDFILLSQWPTFKLLEITWEK